MNDGTPRRQQSCGAVGAGRGVKSMRCESREKALSPRDSAPPDWYSSTRVSTEVTFLLEVDHLAHPRERVFSFVK